MAMIDYSGETFFGFEVLGLSVPQKHCSPSKLKWNIVCPYCKNVFATRLDRIIGGKQQSCGCKNKERFKNYSSQRKKFNTYDMISYSYGVGYDEEGREFYFDKKNFNLIEPYYWTYNENGYIVSRTKYRTDGTIRLHRLIAKCPNDLVVDHIGGNKSDNREINIRNCTIGENDLNKDLLKNNTSGVTGVCFDKMRNKWIAKLEHHGETKLNKRFNTFEEAVMARRQAEEQFFGNFSFNNSQHIYASRLKENERLDINH